MKLKYVMILAGLLIGAAPAISFAACSPACATGEVCRITSQGPPTVYQCKKETATYGRSPTGPRTVQGAGGAAGGSMARSADPNSNPGVAPKAGDGKAKPISSQCSSGREGSIECVRSAKRKQPQ
jgi:hypothetical protein